MAAPTPTGAKSITRFVNLNMVAASDSAKASIGRRRLVGEEREGDREEDAEDDDLQDLPLGHGLRDVLREGVQDHVG